MVSNRAVSWLIALVTTFSYVHEKSRIVSFNEETSVSVKGLNFILDALKRQKPLIDAMKNKDELLQDIATSVDYWIERLDAGYKEQGEESKLPEKITFADARELSEASQKWIDNLSSFYQEPRS